ncbi:hypothetical protein F2P81_015609 [Scophthalmus maximus]|uniref:Uncharacterized protein n=1 Tax=Scophthalmus maximus TaxID=52904 RepID=A0A6A4SJA2_SCOMX|nr:hypothetical protein F2P81_015609 [Scophthalmus maximus]
MFLVSALTSRPRCEYFDFHKQRVFIISSPRSDCSSVDDGCFRRRHKQGPRRSSSREVNDGGTTLMNLNRRHEKLAIRKELNETNQI